MRTSYCEYVALDKGAKVNLLLKGEQSILKAALLHKTGSQVAQETHACIGCNECLFVCPALAEPITIDRLNRETLSDPISAPVARFARSCYQCGACVAPCPVGLHRDAMMMWIKVRLLRSERKR